MSRGKYSKKRQVLERRSERELLVEWLNTQLKVSTVRIEDSAKVLALIAKHTGGVRNVTSWQVETVVNQFRENEFSLKAGRGLVNAPTTIDRAKARKKKRR